MEISGARSRATLVLMAAVGASARCSHPQRCGLSLCLSVCLAGQLALAGPLVGAPVCRDHCRKVW
eukprot:4571955-Pyramimonas_sp.AAC.1